MCAFSDFNKKNLTNPPTVISFDGLNINFIFVVLPKQKIKSFLEVVVKLPIRITTAWPLMNRKMWKNASYVTRTSATSTALRLAAYPCSGWL